MWQKIVGTVLVAVTASACGDYSGEVAPVASSEFQIGSPVVDPAVAAIVISEARGDTLRSDRFNDNLIRLNSMFPDVMSDPAQEASIRREIVKQFVVESLLLSEARRAGLEIDSAVVARRFAEYRDSFENDAAFDAELAQLGQTRADLMDQFRMEMTRKAVSDLVERQTPEPSPTEVENFRIALSERLLAQHILFMIDETMTEKDRRELRQKASTVLDSARSGTNFGDLARRHSDDTGTATVGGELPWFRRGDMVQGFEDAAFSLEKSGDVTQDLAVTTYGYHIIKLVSRQRDEPVSVDSATALLWRQQARKAERDLISRLQANAEVRINQDLVPDFAE